MDMHSYMHTFREPAFRAVIETLQLPAGSRGLDAGCGTGLQCLMLAKAVGSTGHVTGLDISSEFIKCGRENVKEVGLSERISFQEGDVTDLPFDNDTFDWIWSADCVGYGPWEALRSTTSNKLQHLIVAGNILGLDGMD